jgi:hypothetical protein
LCRSGALSALSAANAWPWGPDTLTAENGDQITRPVVGRKDWNVEEEVIGEWEKQWRNCTNDTVWALGRVFGFGPVDLVWINSAFSHKSIGARCRLPLFRLVEFGQSPARG